MHGNVWEWVEDVWHDNYSDAPIDGSAWTDIAGKTSSSKRVIRGGSWLEPSSNIRSANRSSVPPVTRVGSLGFRVARALSWDL